MSPPRRSCIFPGCHSVQGKGSVNLFKFPTDNNLRKQWIDFVKTSYFGEFNITTNTRLCSVHFTPDSYSNYNQVKSGFLKSPLTLVSGSKPTLPVPGVHPPVPPTGGALISTTGIKYPPESSPPTTREAACQCGDVKKDTREIGCQTDCFVGERTVATQLSNRTLVNRNSTACIRNTAHITATTPIQNLRVCLKEKLLCLKMSTLQGLRASVNQRLTMAAQDIFELFERTMAEYKEELCRQVKLPDGAFKPKHQLHRADIQQLLVITEAEPPGQQEWSPSLAQKDPAEQPHIKEEHQLPTSQEEEQLQGLVALIPVKSEEVDDEKPQSTESYQRLTEEIQSKADAEDCRASELARNSDPNGHSQSDTDDESSDFSGHGTDDSSDWEEQPEKKQVDP